MTGDVGDQVVASQEDTVTIEVKRKETSAGFHFLTGTMKNGDKRVMSVDFAVAWKTPEGQVTTTA